MELNEGDVVTFRAAGGKQLVGWVAMTTAPIDESVLVEVEGISGLLLVRHEAVLFKGWTLDPGELGDDQVAWEVFAAIAHIAVGNLGYGETCPNGHGFRPVIGNGVCGPDHDPSATDELGCGCSVLGFGRDDPGPYFVGVWSNARHREAEAQRIAELAEDALDAVRPYVEVQDEHPEGHLAGHDFPCNGCGARWQPSAIEDGAWVILHRPGCTYFEPGLADNEHFVGRRDRGAATVKVLASVLCWIAALLLVVWVPLNHGKVERARACRHAVVESPHLVGLDYHDGRWWQRDGRLVAYAPTEDSTAYVLEGCR